MAGLLWTLLCLPIEKHREADDFRVIKLLNGDWDSVRCGWFGEAALKVQASSGIIYYIQATTWRDKNWVCFLSNCYVGLCNRMLVKHHIHGERDWKITDGVRAQAKCVKFFNTVEQNDRDSADYSTSIQTNRYLLRVQHSLLRGYSRTWQSRLEEILEQKWRPSWFSDWPGDRDHELRSFSGLGRRRWPSILHMKGYICSL